MKPLVIKAIGAACAVVGALVVSAALARPFSVPARDAVATVDVPDDWRPAATTEGVEGSIDDGAVRLSVEYIPASDRNAAVETAAARFKSKGVALAPKPERTTARRINGLDAVKIDYSGHDPSGELAVTLILIAAPGRLGFVAFSYWGDDDAEEAVGNDLLTVADSLKLAK